jgi:hypothetical protein
MRLKVEMGVGHAKGQKVTTEDGEFIEGVKSVRWSANAVERPTVIVEVFAEKCDFELGLSDPPPAAAEPAEPESPGAD